MLPLDFDTTPPSRFSFADFATGRFNVSRRHNISFSISCFSSSAASQSFHFAFAALLIARLRV